MVKLTQQLIPDMFETILSYPFSKAIFNDDPGVIRYLFEVFPHWHSLPEFTLDTCNRNIYETIPWNRNMEMFEFLFHADVIPDTVMKTLVAECIEEAENYVLAKYLLTNYRSKVFYPEQRHDHIGILAQKENLNDADMIEFLASRGFGYQLDIFDEVDSVRHYTDEEWEIPPTIDTLVALSKGIAGIHPLSEDRVTEIRFRTYFAGSLVGMLLEYLS